MSDIKDDANKVLSDIKADMAKLEVVESDTTTFVKIHLVWIISILTFLVGTIVGHFV